MEFLKASVVPVIWSTTYVVTAQFLPPDRPILAAILRALPAGLVLLLIVRTLPKGQWWWKSSVLALANFTGFFGLLFLAAYQLPNGVAAVLTNTSPLVVMILAPFLLGVRVTGLQIGAGLVAVLGVAGLTLTGPVALSPLGVAAGLGASACIGAGTVLAKRWGRPDDVPQIAVTSWQLTLGGLFLVPFLAWEGLPERLTWVNIAGYAYLTIFGALISYIIWFSALARLDAVRVALLAPIAPLCATLIAVVFVNERLSALQWAGGALVVASLAATQLLPALMRKRTQQ
ncbi:EamA family transporter [Corynebacterium hindlerae]|uniref:EamA family transporter n=1 Tax=Corynebacterium hindlerae TaxID=699041 RepID=UPI003AAB6C41